MRLATAGYHVVAAARRADRVRRSPRRSAPTAAKREARQLDVTDRAAVDALADSLERCDVLVANAGGAIGGDQIADSSAADWRAMYEVNVLGTLNVTQALLPKLIASGDGTVVIMSSTAGFVAYEGGGGYVAAKHGTHALAGTLRLELSGQPVRVIEIAPGMVKTAEFAVNRFRGDAGKAAAVYAGVAEPLTDDGHRRRRRLGRHPAVARQRRPDGAAAAGPGRAAQGAPGAVAGGMARPRRGAFRNGVPPGEWG